MHPKTADLWAKQNLHEGDRRRLFTAVQDAIDAGTVLYPGSYVDVAPSLVFESVTYVDIDNRAARFFADADGVREIVTAQNGAPDSHIAFVHADYTHDLDLPTEGFDLLVSLYAGFISEHCTRHLRIGGTLLVNPSHGDAAMASIDPRYELAGIVSSRNSAYTVSTTDLDNYMIPKKDHEITVDLLHETGRGIGYTKSAFAYLFRRIA